MARIILNGESKEIENNATIASLIKDMILPKFFVVEKNLNIIYKENYETELLQDGDSVEIAAFCGGG